MDDRAAILAVGDVHLGTSCSGLPDAISSWGAKPEDLTPAATLRLCIEFAIERQMDAVLFAGDVVESANARFEVMPVLESCVRQLLDAGIDVIAVAGNHDVEALPRLASLIDGFTILGAGGEWESRTIAKDDKPVAEIVGWSFGERAVRQSPVAQLLSKPLAPSSTPVPRIGLLHADLNAGGGNYAPIRQIELDNTGYDAWLLGHIHKPSFDSLSALAGGRPSGYLGSLVGLDRSETGPHGPWIVRLGNGGGIQLEHVPLAPLRWEDVVISVEGIDDVEDVADRLLREAEECVRRLNLENCELRAVGLVARLTGASPCLEQIRRWVDSGKWRDLGRLVDGTAVFYAKIISAIEPQIDLIEIAKGKGPAALMAQRLIDLEQSNDQSRELLEQARTALGDVARDECWTVIDEHRNAVNPMSDAALRDTLLQSGMTALNAMLSQTKPGDTR